MALKRIELVFYMDLETEITNSRFIKNQIFDAAEEAIKDGLHKVSNATIDQVKEDDWYGGGMIPYNQEDDKTIEELLSGEN